MSVIPIPKPSIISSLWKGAKKKNQLTLNSLPIVLATILLLALVYGLVILACLGGISKGLAIGVCKVELKYFIYLTSNIIYIIFSVSFNFAWFCVIYTQMQNL